MSTPLQRVGTGSPRGTGFTLIELLLTVTLFTTLLLSVGGLLTSSLRMQVGWGRTLEPYQQMERALNRLEHDVEAAQPLFAVPFVGEERTLEFARVDAVLTAHGPAPPTWLRVRYRLDPEGSGMALVRQEFLWKDDPETSPPLRSETLMHLRGGGFTFGVEDEQHHFNWAGSWDGKKHGLPQLVQFDVMLPSSGGRPALELSRVVRNPAGTRPTVETP